MRSITVTLEGADFVRPEEEAARRGRPAADRLREYARDALGRREAVTREAIALFAERRSQPSGLSEKEAMEIAIDEVRAMRAERRAAMSVTGLRVGIRREWSPLSLLPADLARGVVVLAILAGAAVLVILPIEEGWARPGEPATAGRATAIGLSVITGAVPLHQRGCRRRRWRPAGWRWWGLASGGPAFGPRKVTVWEAVEVPLHALASPDRDRAREERVGVGLRVDGRNNGVVGRAGADGGRRRRQRGRGGDQGGERGGSLSNLFIFLAPQGGPSFDPATLESSGLLCILAATTGPPGPYTLTFPTPGPLPLLLPGPYTEGRVAVRGALRPSGALGALGFHACATTSRTSTSSTVTPVARERACSPTARAASSDSHTTTAMPLLSLRIQ
jgi:hypothetical protein